MWDGVNERGLLASLRPSPPARPFPLFPDSHHPRRPARCRRARSIQKERLACPSAEGMHTAAGQPQRRHLATHPSREGGSQELSRPPSVATPQKRLLLPRKRPRPADCREPSSSPFAARASSSSSRSEGSCALWLWLCCCIRGVWPVQPTTLRHLPLSIAMSLKEVSAPPAFPCATSVFRHHLLTCSRPLRSLLPPPPLSFLFFWCLKHAYRQ